MQKLQKYLDSITNKNIHIVGPGGTEAAEIALFLNKHGIKNLTFHDFSTKETFPKFLNNSHYGYDIEVINQRVNFFQNYAGTFNYKHSYLAKIAEADLIFVPQSWYLYEQNQPLKELQNKIPFSTITKLYFDLLPSKIVGVTGSNGKTTTTNLIYHLAKTCLKTTDRKVYLTGNDRYHSQLLNNLETITPQDITIIEVSNRQLKINLGRSPNIGVLTTITPNHLEEYKDFEEYKNCKLSLFQHGCEHSVINADDPVTQANKSAFTNITEFSLAKPPLNIDTSQFQLIGKHNLKNLYTAIKVNLLLGADPQCLEANLATFKAPPKRIEYAGTFNNNHYYNDISSTVPETTLLDCEALKEHKNLPITLILGGKAKQLEYAYFCEQIPKYIDSVIAIKSPFLTELTKLKTLMANNWHEVDTLDQAISQDLTANPHEHCTILAPTAIYQAYFKDLDPMYNSFNQLARDKTDKT